MAESLLTGAFIGYVVGSIFFLAGLVGKSRLWAKIAFIATLVGFVLLTGGLVARSLAAGRLPVANLYEFLLLFTWGIVGVYIYTAVKYNLTGAGAVVLPLVVGILGYSSLLGSEIRPLLPALQSYWLKLHVLTAVLAYGAFTVAFALSVLYLLGISLKEDKGQSEKLLDKLIYQLTAFGFAFLTLVILTGAIWAEEVWGTWWSWDPKETWSLITWLIYASYLHLRRSPYWQGKRGAWLSCLGFTAVLFTLLGVTLLLPGLHSYR